MLLSFNVVKRQVEFAKHKFMSTKYKLLAIWSSVIVVLLLGYWFFAHTAKGGSLALYAIGGWGAPWSVKVDCAKDTDRRVEEKFQLPLAFDEKTKDELRGFWYFSYYRACLFRAGYDFSGNEVKPSEIVEVGGETRYVNHFAKVSFVVPEGTTIQVDNAVNPDIDDYIISSTLNTGEYLVYVQVDRSYQDVNSIEELEQDFTGFSTTTAGLMGKRFGASQAGSAILSAHQDNGNFGFVSLNPDRLAVTVFGRLLPQSLLDSIESSFRFIE